MRAGDEQWAAEQSERATLVRERDEARHDLEHTRELLAAARRELETLTADALPRERECLRALERVIALERDRDALRDAVRAYLAAQDEAERQLFTDGMSERAIEAQHAALATLREVLARVDGGEASAARPSLIHTPERAHPDCCGFGCENCRELHRGRGTGGT